MHKIVSAATTGSVGDLGRIARALANAHWNIGAVGGGEAALGGGEVGIIAFAIHDDENDNGDIVALIRGVELAPGRFPASVEEHPALVLELQDEPGQLADAAEVIGNGGHNIMGALLLDMYDGVAHVALGFVGAGDRDEAATDLATAGFTVIEDHDPAHGPA